MRRRRSQLLPRVRLLPKGTSPRTAPQVLRSPPCQRSSNPRWAAWRSSRPSPTPRSYTSPLQYATTSLSSEVHIVLRLSAAQPDVGLTCLRRPDLLKEYRKLDDTATTRLDRMTAQFRDWERGSARSGKVQDEACVYFWKQLVGMHTIALRQPGRSFIIHVPG